MKAKRQCEDKSECEGDKIQVQATNNVMISYLITHDIIRRHGMCEWVDINNKGVTMNSRGRGGWGGGDVPDHT